MGRYFSQIGPLNIKKRNTDGHIGVSQVKRMYDEDIQKFLPVVHEINGRG